MPTALSAFLPEVLISATGCANVVAENFIRNAAIDFCNLTNCVEVVLDPITVKAGELDTELTVGSATELVKIISVYADGKPIDPINELTLRSIDRSWKAATGTPSRFIDSESGLRLFPTPVNDVLIDCCVSTRPKSGASSIDDRLFTRWKSAIVHGALNKLLAIPKQPFTDIALAEFHGREYVKKVYEANAAMIRRMSGAPLRTVPA